MSIDIDYVFSSGLWSFSGLLAGYAIGKIECQLQRTRLPNEENRRDDT
jgi:hypothetical protein